MSEDSKRIGVVGLGKLGACVAACLASRGFDVIGIDAEPGKVEAIQNGRAPVDEPGLQQKIDEGSSRLRATTNFAEVVKHSEVCFFITPTPSLPDGSFENQYLIQALQAVASEVAADRHGRCVQLRAARVARAGARRGRVPRPKSLSVARSGDARMAHRRP